MESAETSVVRLADYAPPEFWVDDVALTFDLDPDATRVSCRLRIRRNPAAAPERSIRLAGAGLELQALRIDGVPAGPSRFRTDAQGLEVLGAPDQFDLETDVVIRPRRNPGRTGLMEVGGVLMTQCEPEGFRRLTFFPDRPDVLARYTVTLRADPARYPVLLSNGDKVADALEPDGRRCVVFHDPHLKPSYIFAVVAGDLAVLQDTYVTSSARPVAMSIYADRDNIGRCDFAMQVLKRALAWDEETYGLEYDLGVFALAAVTGWSGAMENKGLNLFGASGVIADPQIATDDDYIIIERIVAHELFHNWTGNRVTCRDWFQLCLKEGLTRFRDQHFIEDRLGAGVWRIESVRALRRNQFAEDDGPAAHPIQPAAFAEIENFYTNTVYDKGAEIFRMLRNLLGPAGFRAAFDRYIADNDGRAATMEDFLAAAEASSGRDLRQFRRWVNTAGRPRVRATGAYEPEARRYRLRLEQSPPGAEPFMLPVAIGLLGKDGRPLSFRAPGAKTAGEEAVIALTALEDEIVLEDVAAPAIPSLLRGFSAPVTVLADIEDADLATLMVSDPDPFARWDAGQTLAVRAIRDLAQQHARGGALAPPTGLVAAYRAILADAATPDMLRAFTLLIPDEPVLSEGMAKIDLDGLMAGRAALREAVAGACRDELRAVYDACRETGDYTPDPVGIGRRKLKAAVLDLILAGPGPEGPALALRQLTDAGNMTDAFEALSLLMHLDAPEREEGAEWFYRTWRDVPTVIDKWFNAQALSRAPGAIDRIIALEGHPDFDPANFPRGLAFYGGFFRQNRVTFHDPSGKGYEFLADRLLTIDRMGRAGSTYLMPQINQWRRYDRPRRALMRAALERVANTPNTSKGLRENIRRALEAGGTVAQPD